MRIKKNIFVSNKNSPCWSTNKFKTQIATFKDDNCEKNQTRMFYKNTAGNTYLLMHSGKVHGLLDDGRVARGEGVGHRLREKPTHVPLLQHD